VSKPSLSPGLNLSHSIWRRTAEPTEELLLKLEIIGGTIIGDFLDSATPEGKAILNSLLDGLEFEPPLTVKTKPDVDQSTLYRFD